MKKCLACKDKGDAQPYCCYYGLKYKGKTTKQNNYIELPQARVEPKVCKMCARELVIKKVGNKTEYLCPKILESWFCDYSETHTNYVVFDSGLMLNYSTACEPY